MNAVDVTEFERGLASAIERAQVDPKAVSVLQMRCIRGHLVGYIETLFPTEGETSNVVTFTTFCHACGEVVTA